MIALEDLKLGEVIELGTVAFSRKDILEFARQYDPQPFHVNEAEARVSVFGGLIASGWHTASACMRLIVENFLNHTRSMGSPGIDEMRWLRPVRPGEVLRLRGTVIAIEPSKTREDRGRVRFLFEGVNQAGERAITVRSTFIIGKRRAFFR
jgi:acyl dehydratase